MMRRQDPEDVSGYPSPEAALRLLVDDVDAGCFVVDHHRVIRFANRALAGLHGVDDPATLVGRDFLDMVAPADVARIELGFRDAMERVAAPAPVAMQLLRRDGSTADVSLTARRLFDDGRPTGACGVVRDTREVARMGSVLREREGQYHDLVNALDDIVYTGWLGPSASEHRVTFVSREVERVLGIGVDEVLSSSSVWRHLLHADDLECVRAAWRKVRAGRAAIVRYRLRDRATGTYRWFDDHICPRQDATGRAVAYTGVARDVSAQVARDEELERANRQLAALVTHLEQHRRHDASISELTDMLQTCESTGEAAILVERFAERLFPDAPGAVFLLPASRDVFEPFAWWRQQAPSSFPASACWALRRGRPYESNGPGHDLACEHARGAGLTSTFCVPMSAQADTVGVLVVSATTATMSDDRARLAEALARRLSLALANLRLRLTLRHQSTHDPLTGLYNRRWLDDVIDVEVRRAWSSSRPLTLLMVDVDHFKHFNDTFRHEAGDAVLRELGATLQASVRAHDIACRYGGEEFAILLPDTPTDTGRARAEELRARVADLRLSLDAQPLGAVTVSIGVASLPDDGVDALGLLNAADHALRCAKQSGRNRVCSAPQFAPSTASGQQ